MRRVLFLDDELRILEGLRRMLRSQSHEWEMALAEIPALLAEA
jgi:YesN/AraC family two-component response regulator